jgi:RNA polymerase sigma factor, sigma-70 family
MSTAALRFVGPLAIGTSYTSSEHDNELIVASQNGDLHAFNVLVKRYERRVYGLCYRLLGDQEQAADVTQEVFLSAFRHICSFNGGPLAPWILRIASNACVDHLRARRRRPSESLDYAWDDEENAYTFEIADSSERPEEAVLRNELGEQIIDALNQLHPDQRSVIVMSDIQDLSYEEIAQISGLALGTVKSRISRGRARLREILRAEGF